MKVAIVSGASQGIGAGVAAALVGAGYAVVGTSRSIAPSREHRFLTIPGDIAEPETAQHVIEQTLDRFGRIDTLVNNAGIFIGKPFTDYTRADYDAGPAGAGSRLKDRADLRSCALSAPARLVLLTSNRQLSSRR